MQQANELLYGILKTLGKIEQNTRSAKGGEAGAAPKSAGAGIKDKISILSNLGPSLLSFGKVKPKNIKDFFKFIDEFILMGKKAKSAGGLENLSRSLSTLGQGLPSLASGLDALGKIKNKQVERAIYSLGLLYDFLEKKGAPGSTQKVDRAVKTFEKIGNSLQKVAKPIKDISLSFAYLGFGILAFAGSLLLTGMLLKLAKPTDVLLFLGITILGLMVMFGTLALANKFIKKGTTSIVEMGLGMAALALGILSFALVMKVIPMILGKESDGSIIKSLLIMVGIVGAMALMYGILSLVQPLVKKGFISILLMSAGMLVLSIAILGMAQVAKMLSTGLSSKKDTKDEKDENKKNVIKGLGTMGIIILASVALFSLLGIPVVAGLVMTGALTAIMMAGALFLLAVSVKKLVSVGKELGGEDIAGTISHLIGGTLEGFLEGLSPLAGTSKNPVVKMMTFMKNSAKVFAGVAVLMSMSVALSMFAKAVSAFAEIDNMRVIEGTDKDGKPIFGEKVNLKSVADNMSYTISTFLKALIDSTQNLTRSQAGAIKKMGRALTGRRGILTAVIQFADAMKVYAQFGEKNEIGYVDYDDKGNEIHKKVKAVTVVDNIISSFLYFTEQLFSSSEKNFGDGEEHATEAGISGKQRRRMKRMSKALVGKNGILGAVVQFAEVLSQFAQYGPKNQLPILDKDGKPTGEFLTMDQIALNIVSALTKFSDTLTTGLEGSKPKDAKKALEKYNDIIEELSKFSESLTGLEKANDTISNLAKSLNDLSVSLDNFDTGKLSKLAAISVSTGGGGEGTPGTAGGITAEKIQATNKAIKESSTPAINWDIISSQIGDSVGAHLVEAMKKGQVKFEFSPSSPGKGVLSFD
jgi:flagellar hook-basal body complex protein FliE